MLLLENKNRFDKIGLTMGNCEEKYHRGHSVKILYIVLFLLFALPCFAEEQDTKVYTDADLKPQQSNRKISPAVINKSKLQKRPEDMKYPLSYSPNAPVQNQPELHPITKNNTLPQVITPNAAPPSVKPENLLNSFMAQMIAGIWKLVVFMLLLYGLILLVKIKFKNKGIHSERNRQPSDRPFRKIPKKSGAEEFDHLLKTDGPSLSIPSPAIADHFEQWHIKQIYETLGNIDWYQFEKFCEALLLAEGYTVMRKGGAHPDGGVDLIATKDGESMLVQCKHWKTWEIKPKTVREMVGTMTINEACKGAIYTLKGGTAQAQDLAFEQDIPIMNGWQLAERALKLSKDQLDNILKTDEHHCPKCEAKMVWREGNFKPFWGCSRYPRCRGTLKYTGAL